MSQIIDPIYLPFTADELTPHFLVDASHQIAYYERSARDYRDFVANNPERNGIPISESRRPCQIEKDERFWTATAMKRLVAAPTGLESALKSPLVDVPRLPISTTGHNV